MAKKAQDLGNQLEVEKILNNEFKRTKINVGKFHNNFSKEKVKDAEDEVYGMGIYSDDESKESIHYSPGHNVNYYSEDKINEKKRNKKSESIFMKSPIDKKSPKTDNSLSDDDFECKKKN